MSEGGSEFTPSKPSFSDSVVDLEEGDTLTNAKLLDNKPTTTETLFLTPENVLDKLTNLDWQDKLEKTPGFFGNSEKGAHLMRKYTEGMDAAYKIRKEQGKVNKDTRTPNVELSYNNVRSWFDVKNNKLYVSINDLNQSSLVNPQQQIVAMDKNGEVVFEGSIEDSYLLAGSEEFIHALDQQRENLPKEQLGYKPNQVVETTTEYDSSDTEYRGLGIRVLVAKRKNMPDKTQNILRQRLARAIEYRKSHSISM